MVVVDLLAVFSRLKHLMSENIFPQKKVPGPSMLGWGFLPGVPPVFYTSHTGLYVFAWLITFPPGTLERQGWPPFHSSLYLQQVAQYLAYTRSLINMMNK